MKWIKLLRVQTKSSVHLSPLSNRLFASVFVTSLLILAGGCKVTSDGITITTATPTPTPSQSPSPTPTPVAVTQFVVAVDSNGSQNSIKTFSVATSGALTLAQTHNVASVGNYVVGHPNLNYVYALTAGGGAISAYSISANGTLTELSSSPSTLANYHEHLVVEPLGRFLYSTDSATGDVSVFRINQSTGALTAVTSTGSCGGNCSATTQTVDPSGKFLYVAAQGSDGTTNGIYSFAINQSTGALTAIAGSPYLFTNEGNGPYGIIATGDGRYLVSGNTGNTANVGSLVSSYSSFAINSSTGQLTYIGSLASAVYPLQMATDSAGHVYSTDGNSGNLLSVQLNSSGLPTATAVVASGGGGVAVDLSGLFIYGSTGSTSSISQSRFTTAPAASPLSPATVSITSPFGLSIATYR